MDSTRQAFFGVGSEPCLVRTETRCQNFPVLVSHLPAGRASLHAKNLNTLGAPLLLTALLQGLHRHSLTYSTVACLHTNLISELSCVATARVDHRDVRLMTREQAKRCPLFLKLPK